MLHYTICPSFFLDNLQDGKPAGNVKKHLAARGINVSVSTAGSTRLHFEREGLKEVVRASVHYFNNENDLEKLVQALGSLG